VPIGVRLAPLALAVAVATGRAQAPPDSGQPVVRPGLTVRVARSADGVLQAPVVRAQGALASGAFATALRDGFPVALHFTLELRRSVRIFADRLEREAQWDAVVLLDPLTNEFTLIRTGGSEEHFTAAAALERALATPFTVDLMPTEPGQHYYVVTLNVESLSLSELEEAERWLKGDLAPAVSRSGDVGNSLGRGVRRLLIRLSGLPHRQLEARSAYFTP
jgi:hypothetical protein